MRFLSTHPHKEISQLAKGQLLEIDKLNAQSMQMWRERWAEQIKEIAELDFVDLSKGLEILSGFKIAETSFELWQKEVRRILEKNTSKEIKMKLLRQLEHILKEQFVKKGELNQSIKDHH